MFLIAQITSFPHIPTDFGGLPATMNLVVFQIGLPGVAPVLTYGQLVSQIFVEEFTLQFLNLPGCELVVRLSLGEFMRNLHIVFYASRLIESSKITSNRIELYSIVIN